MNIKKHIPNFLTCCNLLCGCLGIYLSLNGVFGLAIGLIWAALIFDFLDGFMARMLGVHSAIGKELDSLADMVTFGVLPGFLLVEWMKGADLPDYVPFIGLLVPIFSALRLAKFNIDERQTSSFIGLPTPANCLFIASLYFLEGTSLEWLSSGSAMVIISILFSLLLVAPIPMFSLKIKSFGWKGNELRILFLLACIALLIIFHLAAFSPIIVLYIVISLIFYRDTKNNEMQKETF